MTAPTAPTRTALARTLIDLVHAYGGRRGPIVIETRALGLDPSDTDTMARALGFAVVEEGPGNPRYVARSEWEARVRAEAPRPVVKPAPAKPAAPVAPSPPSRYWSTGAQAAGSTLSTSAPRPVAIATPAPARNLTAEIYARREAEARQWAGEQPAPDMRQATGPRTLAQIAADVYGGDRAGGGA